MKRISQIILLLALGLAGCAGSVTSAVPTTTQAATQSTPIERFATATDTILPSRPDTSVTQVTPTLPAPTVTPVKLVKPTLPLPGPCDLSPDPHLPVTAVTEVELLDDAHCQIHLPPVSRYPGDRLGGFSLSYPNTIQPQAEDWETLIFEFPWPSSLRITRARTGLQLEQVEAASLPFEFTSLPVIDVRDTNTGREVMQIGDHQVVAIDSEIYDVILRRYFVLSNERVDGQADLLVFALYTYSKQDQPARRDQSVEAEVEALIATLRFDPPDQPVIDMSTGPDLPVIEPVLPLGVLVEGHRPKERLTILAPDGVRLGGYSPERIGGPIEEIFVIGPWRGNDHPLPLLTFDGTPSTRQRVYAFQEGRVLQEIEAPWTAFLRAAPGQPVIAYTTIDGSANLYFGSLGNFPLDPVIHTGGGGGGPYPYAIDARAGQPLGLWFTDRPWGIGGFVFLLDSGLSYYDAATRTTREVLPAGGTGTMGLSPDYSTIAYFSGSEQQIVILQLAMRQEVRFGLDPWTELAGKQLFRPPSAGEARFSPDNRYIAWAEAVTYEDDHFGWGEHPRTRLRVEELNLAASGAGELKHYNLLDSGFASAAGFEPDILQPIGWLDAQTLLLQAAAFSQPDQVALLAFHVHDGSGTHFSAGRFIDFVYGEQ